jgi:folate-binding protein YgfZ
MHGRDPIRMIQGLVSNDVAGAPPDRAVYATMLTPKGRLIGDMRVLREGADILLEADSGALEGIAANLRKFIPPLFARSEDVSAVRALVGVYGPQSATILTAALGEAVVPAGLAEGGTVTRAFADHEIVAIRTLYTADEGFDVIVPREAAGGLVDALTAVGATPISPATLDVLRIEAGSPRWGAELTEDVIPIEAGLLESAISQKKGCYTGQEVIVRILHRGHVNRHLRGLLFDEGPPPETGTELLSGDGKKVGRITSACVSPRLGRTIGLGYVRREIEPGAIVHLDTPEHTAATVTSLPFAVSHPDSPR